LTVKMSDVLLRNARVSDVETLVALWRRFMSEHEETVCGKRPRIRRHYALRRDAPKLTRAYFKKRIYNPRTLVLVAEAGGRVVGFATCLIKKNPPVYKLDKMGCVGSIYVEPSFRGRGIGSKFKEAAFAWFKKKGLSEVTLTVDPRNRRTHKIYKHWGFSDFHAEMRLL